jgi:hypothetical protein
MSVVVAPCDSKAARYAVEQWHYSKRLPLGPCVRYGVWEHERFIGVVLFSRGANPNIGKPFGLTQTECVELTRVALTKHDTTTTAVVAEALRMLHRDNPGLRVVVSYADAWVGHIGKIYQAGNWIYLGTSKSTPIYVDPSGREYHHRLLTGKQFDGADPPVDPKTLRVVHRPDKYRYAYPLDRAMRRRLAKMAKPYPVAA